MAMNNGVNLKNTFENKFINIKSIWNFYASLMDLDVYINFDLVGVNNVNWKCLVSKMLF